MIVPKQIFYYEHENKLYMTTDFVSAVEVDLQQTKILVPGYAKAEAYKRGFVRRTVFDPKPPNGGGTPGTPTLPREPENVEAVA